VGAYYGARGARNQAAGEWWQWILGGAVVGGFGGVLVWLVDHPAPKPQFGDISVYRSPGAWDAAESPAEPGSLIDRALALLSVLFFVFPIVGLVVALVAFYANRRTSGWPRSASRIALALSLISSIGLLALIAMETIPA
jgi:hypothetical protein